jgi:hypothetical protein
MPDILTRGDLDDLFSPSVDGEPAPGPDDLVLLLSSCHPLSGERIAYGRDGYLTVSCLACGAVQYLISVALAEALP